MNYQGFIKALYHDWDTPQTKDPFDRDTYDIVYAHESSGSYSGELFVVLADKKTKELFEWNDSHCSCDGYSDTWDLEPTTLESILQRKGDIYEKFKTVYNNYLLHGEGRLYVEGVE